MSTLKVIDLWKSIPILIEDFDRITFKIITFKIKVINMLKVGDVDKK